MKLRNVILSITITVFVITLAMSCDIFGMFIEPEAPTNLGVFQVSDNTVELAWVSNSNNETAFEIETRSDPAETWLNVGSAERRSSRYIVTGLMADTKYYFKARAANQAGYSGYTSEISVTTLGTGQTTITPEVRILTPADGATVTGPFNLSFSVSDWRREVAHDTHLHPFVDDVNQGAVFALVPLTFDLDPGFHTLTLKLANPDHTFIGVQDTIEVTVE